MLKLYTNTSFFNETHRKHVFPLLFDLWFLKSEKLKTYYTLVNSVSESDIVVFPIDYKQFYKFKTDFKLLISEARNENKPIWVYTAGDYGFSVYLPNSYNFRFGGFDSKLDDNTYIMPSFINDPHTTHLKQTTITLKKEKKPSIGFVGHAKSGILKYAKEAFSYLKLKLIQSFGGSFSDLQTFYPSATKRALYLRKLDNSKLLNTNFILREKYRSGVVDEEEKQLTTKEFYKNIFNTSYTFCIRGVGNFSVRFYETLAVGRIPILLNTDCRLPLSHIINWNKHCVILDKNKKESLEQQILEFHNSINDDDFQMLQKNNRLLWETHLERNAFFMKVHDTFKIQNKND